MIILHRKNTIAGAFTCLPNDAEPLSKTAENPESKYCDSANCFLIYCSVRSQPVRKLEEPVALRNIH